MADREEWEKPEILKCLHFKNMVLLVSFLYTGSLIWGSHHPKGLWVEFRDYVDLGGKILQIFFTNLQLKYSISLYYACSEQTTAVPDILWAIKIIGILGHLVDSVI